jgi:hypothetical protein
MTEPEPKKPTASKPSSDPGGGLFLLAILFLFALLIATGLAMR